MSNDTDSLRDRVVDYFANHAPSFGLDPKTLEVEFVLNWGGFVNSSYRIRDAKHAYHLKLSSAAEEQESLRRWVALAPMLEPYHVPPILEWIDIGSAAGPLFPHLAGDPPSLSGDVIAELVLVLQQLNADQVLASALQPPHTVTARLAYLTSFHRRFIEDLNGIRESPPPFVDEPLLRRLEDEIGVLSQLVASCSAFDEPLTKPVHGDLWLNNVLWVNRDHWYLIDWDDMRIGDPAADIATLLGPTAADPRPLKLLEQVEGVLASAERERLQHLGRATLLDWVIDPLSDWIDARTAPAHARSVRVEKEQVHRRALACYTELYR